MAYVEVKFARARPTSLVSHADPPVLHRYLEEQDLVSLIRVLANLCSPGRYGMAYRGCRSF